MRVRFFLPALLLTGCVGSPRPGSVPDSVILAEEKKGGITLTSPSFSAGGAMPLRLASQPEGKSLSPALSWTSPPVGSRELVILCTDPDADGWVHWVASGIQPFAGSVKEGELPKGTVLGKNSWGSLGYRGPQPPPGKPHRYVFTLIASSKILGLQPGQTKDEVLNRIGAAVLSWTTVEGTFQSGH